MNKFEEAVQLRKSGKFEEARSQWLELLDEQPLNPSVWYQCAWIHDILGLEREAVPFYKKSLELGLQAEEKQGALLGLGSTYRTLGMYEDAQFIFEQAMREFPERREYQVFYAMVLYNQRAYGEAMSILFKQLAETSSDEGIRSYKKAILLYSDQLDRIWD
ncbi:tetratricopeptide repeat protein [Paenibacillus sp. SAF-054]|uniref:tetratricopeptide repeat protein n=1 Tax=unclassified Paenibacillus TaxID=185978 RepID=UPI003F803C03